MRTTISRIFLGVLFIAAGINHFVRPSIYRAIMPDYLPWHNLLIALSGVAEAVLGFIVLFRRWDRFSRWALTALLIAVFPANMEMVIHPERFQQIPLWLLWLRLPLQAVLIAWVWWTTEHQAST